MDNTAIQLTNVTKIYTLTHEKPTLVERTLRMSKVRDERFTALSDVSLTIKKGERVGVIGPNGSGKTTLLKIIAGISTPSSGTAIVRGKLISLIELGAGFHPDLTGLQNIFLNGMIIGMHKNEITRKLKNIIQFADLHQFIDAPLYTYSSGMRLRLGFAIAVHASPDILILDEGLSVGDRFFQEKAKRKIQELFRKNLTIVIVSHDLEFIRTHCKRVILLNQGRVSDDGTTSIIRHYKAEKIHT